MANGNIINYIFTCHTKNELADSMHNVKRRTLLSRTSSKSITLIYNSFILNLNLLSRDPSDFWLENDRQVVNDC